MKRGNFLTAGVIGVMLAFILSAFLQAQPLSKRYTQLSLKDKTHQILIPFNKANYERVGPLSKSTYLRIRTKAGIKNLITSEKENFFLTQKRHLASFNTIHKTKGIRERQRVKNFFLDGKRHL